MEKGKATLAKAVIALANHGGGFLVLGFGEGNGNLQSTPRPSCVPEVTQDAVNESVRRYAEPEFHCRVHNVTCPDSGTLHPIIGVPGGEVPVMAKRDHQTAGVSQHKIYIRKPGPRSEEPHTAEEWRRLTDRCIWARREEMLDSIRAIVVGRVQESDSPPQPLESLTAYCTAAYNRWNELAANLQHDSPSRFPLGFYEMGFALIGAISTDLPQLRMRLAAARSIAFSGWPPFLDITGEHGFYPYDGFIEAWIGRPADSQMWNDPAHADFWRASVDGNLYTIRGYIEDSELAQDRGRPPGTEFTTSVPCIRLAEGILFASRLADQFEGVEQIAIRCRFTGLQGRSLILVDHPIAPFTSIGPVTHDPQVLLTGQVSLQQVHDNLIEVIHGLVRPLYERFGFYEIPISHVQDMLMKMRRYR